MSPLLIGGIVFAVIVALSFAMGGDEDDTVKDRMTMFASMSDVEEEEPIQDEKPRKAQKRTNPLLQKIGQIITPKGIANHLEASLEKADVPLRANEFAGIIFLVGTFPGGAVWLVLRNPMLTLVAVGVGFLLPFLWLKITYMRRLRQFNDQMLDTLTLLANAVKAGYSMVQAMEMVAKESPPPMGAEFGRVIREVSLGVTIEDALTNMKNRVPSNELDLMVTVIMIQRQIGGNLSEILESIAHTIRERNKLLGMINSLTAQGRMSGIVIGGLPVVLAVILYVINPAYISLLWKYHYGAFHAYYIIVVCVAMELLGFYIISKITTVEV